MTTDQVGAALLAAGLAPAEVPEKCRLFELVERAATQASRVGVERAWWVPGRLEVFGTHTDYAGGRSLVSAVPRGFVVAAGRRTDHVVRVLDARWQEDVSVDLRAGRSAPGGWRRYVDAVARRLARNFPGAALGADIAVGSDLPRASGMSSSSALVVGIATALVELGGLRNRPEWQASIAGAVDEATYYSCLENGLAFRGLAGDTGVGTHGGSEDHAAMLCGAPGALTEFSFVPMVRLAVVPVPAGWQFVVCSSGVTAEKTGAARDAYNRLAACAAALVALWNESGGTAASLGAILGSPGALDRLRELVGRSTRADWPAAALSNRLEHFVRENARVTAALTAFRRPDAAHLGQLASASQRDAEHLLENQVEATVMLTRAALDEGALAARSFGAGFGGSVWALVERDGAAAFAERWLARYRSRFTGGDSAVAFPIRPAPPVVELMHSPARRD